MTHGRKRSSLWLLLLLVGALVAVGIGGVVRHLLSGPPGVPAELVPPSWTTVREGPGHRAHLASGKVACKDCHDFARDGFVNPGTTPCATCHDKEAAHEHRGNAETKTDCLTCHAFVPGRKEPASTCIGCHAQVEGHAAAIGVHATAPCTTCHKLHEEPTIQPARCEGCHDQRATSHGVHAGSKDCLDCHTGHAKAETAIAKCSGCHASPAGPKPASHDTCIGCHQPHAFRPPPNVCVGCHGAKPTLGASHVSEHTICTNCHTPHAPTTAAASCTNCHTGVHVVAHPKDACVDCHAPHGHGDRTALASTSPAPLPRVDPCTSCHAPVAPTDSGAHRGGIACTNCHPPHDFTPPDRKLLCPTCHAAEATAAATSKGHGTCASCHGPNAHAPQPAPACATCHAKEHDSAPQGHLACASCHQAHAGSIPTAAICPTCHETKAKGPHLKVPGTCLTCHQPHGPTGSPKPPPCTSCHVSTKLPSLHTVPAHATCTNCHSSHDGPRADRATCTGSCHADRRTHMPDAATCTGCHMFRE